MLTRRSLLAGSIFSLLLAAGAAGAQERPPAAPINTLGGEGAAIRGTDVVSYFLGGGPQVGRTDITADYAGATWRFADESNRAAFVADLEAYVPAYGGFCAFGASRNYLVKIEPDAWTIREGKLYLNYDRSVRDTWLADPAAFIARADANWPGLAAGPSPAR